MSPRDRWGQKEWIAILWAGILYLGGWVLVGLTLSQLGTWGVVAGGALFVVHIALLFFNAIWGFSLFGCVLIGAGYSRWNGRLLAEHLGDVSKDQVWRVMRKHDLHLERRQSWCVSTDPEFSRKAADVVGLYLHPPQNALVLCVDEKPCIQALERAQGWIRLPNGRALTGFAHEYKRHGTTTLFAALEVATGLVHSGHYRRRRRREFLDFMNELVAKYPDKELHVVLDNLNTHKPKEDRWLKTHPQVHFHFIPTHSSWLNQVECWFSILSRSALQGSSFTSVRMLVQAMEAFIGRWNQNAAPFEWTKHEVHQQEMKRSYADLCN
jgi:transposase